MFSEQLRWQEARSVDAEFRAQQSAHLKSGIGYGVTLRGDYSPNEECFEGSK